VNLRGSFFRTTASLLFKEASSQDFDLIQQLPSRVLLILDPTTFNDFDLGGNGSVTVAENDSIGVAFIKSLPTPLNLLYF